jgi:hypothetical protein
MFNLIPGGFGGRVTRSYVGGAALADTALSITATVNLGTETGDRRVVIVCGAQSASSPANAMAFSGFSMTGSPTIDTLYSAGVLDGIVGRSAAIGIAHVPTGTSGISVAASFSQGGTLSTVSKGILIYSVYGLSVNTPYANGAYGSYDFPVGSMAIGLSQTFPSPSWTGLTQDAYQGVCSGASYESTLGETGRSISASSASLQRVILWAPN